MVLPKYIIAILCFSLNNLQLYKKIQGMGKNTQQLQMKGGVGVDCMIKALSESIRVIESRHVVCGEIETT